MARLEGFNLHADRWVDGQDRQGLERLCRYGSRGPVAMERLSSGGAESVCGFLVEKGTPGFNATEIPGKDSLRAAGT